jgi:hypothetical protein
MACLSSLSISPTSHQTGWKSEEHQLREGGGLERKKPLERNCYLMIYVDDESARTFVFVST